MFYTLVSGHPVFIYTDDKCWPSKFVGCPYFSQNSYNEPLKYLIHVYDRSKLLWANELLLVDQFTLMFNFLDTSIGIETVP